MAPMRLRPTALAVPVSLLLLWGCGSDGDTSSAPSEASTTDEADGDEPGESGTDDSTFADGLDDEDDAMGVVLGDDGESYGEFEEVVDDLEDLRMEVPTAFGDVDTAPLDGRPAIFASSDLEAFQDGWEVGALVFFATDAYDLTSEQYAEQVRAADAEDPSVIAAECEPNGSEQLEEQQGAATIVFWSDCGGTDTQYVVAYVEPSNPDVPILALEGQITSDADTDAFTRAFESLSWKPEI